MTRHLIRDASTLLVAGLTATLLLPAPTAAAHPLGNFSVNHYTGLTLRPDRVDARIIVDRAEIAAAQERPAVDADRSGTISAEERAAYAAVQCAERSDRLEVQADGTALVWGPGHASFRFLDGEGGLRTSRLTCALTAPAALTRSAAVEVRTRYDTRRVGWQEMTARGQGVRLLDSPLPSRSVTDELRTYPGDPLADPQERTAADFRTVPGQGADAEARPPSSSAGPLARAADQVSDTFQSLAGRRELTLPVGLLALLLAVVLGASHAVLPGHGKTIMAAYLAGRRGTPRDAVTVGVTVTFTHTAGVLVLGLALPLATHLAGEAVLTWLGTTSGLIVTGIGLWLLRAARNGDPLHGHTHSHGHGHTHSHGHGHTHSHSHGHAHSHGHGHTHAHHEHAHHGQDDGREPGTADHAHPVPEEHDADGRGAAVRPHAPLPQPQDRSDEKGGGGIAVLPAVETHTSHRTPHLRTRNLGNRDAPPGEAPRASRPSRAGLIGLGIAGGLVPSPSALVVLLGAVALGRTSFGILLVIGYGLGMAATLTLAGLLLVRLRDRWAPLVPRSRFTSVRALARFAPFLTSVLVILVGIGLTADALSGP